MAIVETKTERKADSNRRTDRNGEPLPDAKVWLNIGYIMNDPETGEEVFIGLPRGVALDTMPTENAGGSQIRQAKNKLRSDLIEAALSELQPGQTAYLPLKIQVRRVEERAEPTADNNPFIAQMQPLTLVRG